MLGLSPTGDEARKAHEAIVRQVLRSGTKLTLLTRTHHPTPQEYRIERIVPNPPVVRDEHGKVSNLLPQEILPRVEVHGQHEISELTRSGEKLTRLLDRFAERDASLVRQKTDLRQDLEKVRRAGLDVRQELRQIEERLATLPGLEETLKRYRASGLEDRLRDQSLLVREEKQRRQFIFSTHNANIPVLGDAELILGLTASGEADTGGARIEPEHMGSIDTGSVRELIEAILEGGKEAFERRRRKYSFLGRIMNRSKLLELIRNGENAGVEFKRADVKTDSLAKEMSALLNHEGGWQQLLLNLDLLTEIEGRIYATVAGLLLFGQNPNRRLPQAGITAVAFPGREKDYAAVDQEWIRGPLASMRSLRRRPLEKGVIDRAVDFVERNAGAFAWLEGARRRRKKALPRDAVREAIVNAVAHRDYSISGTDIEISLYADRLEVISPGRLPNGITIEKMMEGGRAARNELVKEILRDYGYAEHWGMGVRNRIIATMREHNGTEPGLIEEEHRFTVRLWKEQDSTRA